MTTSEKIMVAARGLFMRQGFASTTTREIAQEAGVNLALVNYHFGSKDQLFAAIMYDHLRAFFGGLLPRINDASTTLDEKLTYVADAYITMLTAQPELPIFILSELRARPDAALGHMTDAARLTDSVLFRQLREASGTTSGVAPIHLFINLLALTVFPFVAQPMLHRVAAVDARSFAALMEERRTLIPLWIKAMFTVPGARP